MDRKKLDDTVKDKIKITVNESYDYFNLKCGDYYDEGHNISIHTLTNLLKHLGYKVEKNIISDEEMENLC